MGARPQPHICYTHHHLGVALRGRRSALLAKEEVLPDHGTSALVRHLVNGAYGARVGLRALAV